MTQNAVRAGRKKANRAPIEAKLRLGAWAERGATAAELEGVPVRVHLGIPGESVVASVRRGRRPWWGTVTEVLEPSQERIEPPCPYFRAGCGGCQLQHVEYRAQIRMKEQLANRHLELAGVAHGIDRMWEMPEPWRYRRTAAIALGWEAGFRPRGRRGIVEIHDCLIAHPSIGRLCHRLNEVLSAGSLLNYHGKVWLDCAVVGSEDTPRLQIVIQGIEGLTLEAHPELPSVASLLGDIEPVASVAYRHRSGMVLPLLGDLLDVVQLPQGPMYLSAGSFFQTNVVMLQVLLRRMREELRNGRISEAADVYGGVGALGLSVADLVGQLTLIELDPAATEAARRTATEWRLTNVRFVAGHAERALRDLPQLDLIVVDPPRSGLGATAVAAALGRSARVMLYVSCSPPSLATDLAMLQAGGYAIDSIELFDFYPQTHHVEALTVLRR